MTGIDLHNGKFYLNGQFFEPQIEIELAHCRTFGKNIYCNRSMYGEVKTIPIVATGYYKNKKLKSITLTIEPEYLKASYHPPQDVDFCNYLTPQVDLWKNITEELIQQLTNSNKRNFEWGKVKIQVDPRDLNVYCEIKYY